jgi:HEAT repeat protein
MTRISTTLAVVMSALAFASPRDEQKANEASGILEQMLRGEVPVNQAVNRISYLGQEPFVSAMLADLLSRPAATPNRKALALQAMAMVAVPSGDAEKALVKCLDDDDVGRLRNAAQALARIKGRSARPKLEKLLTAKQLGVRLDAAKTLGVLGDPKSGAPLLKAAQAEEDPETRAEILRAVGRAGDKKQVAGLQAFLDNSSESARNAAAHALCLLGDPKGLDYAKKRLASEDKFERVQAVLLLDGVAVKIAGPLLEPLLKDPDARVRAKAAKALYSGGDTSKLEWLVLESRRTPAEHRGPFEDELESMHLSDEQRAKILEKAKVK